MTNTDELIEAVDYAKLSGENWWEVFDSIQQAEKTLKKALKENPDDYQIAQLADLLDEDIFESNPFGAFRNCIKQLRKQLKQG